MSSSRFEPLSQPLQGGYSSVSRVFDHHLGRQVALKRSAAEAEAIRQWRMEGEVLRAVQHLHLVQLIEQGEDEAGHFSVFEWLPGTTLESLAASSPLAEKEVSQMMKQILAALTALHGAGYAHGDVNGSNVMLIPQCQVKVIDLGNASALSSPKSGATGSIFYMAPELFDGQPPTVATDYYALGVLGYELLTGRLPFEGETRPQVIAAHHRHWRTPLQERCVTSCEMAEIVEAFISVQPGQRILAAELLNR